MNINLPACIYKDKKITVSADGSHMFYSLQYNEAYRAKSVGAFTESYHKFVLASKVLDKMPQQDVRILDICFGLGYNCAVTFEYASKLSSDNRVHIVSIEKDPHLPCLVNSLNFMWPLSGYNILRECLGFKNKSLINNKFSMEMHITDALDAIYNLSGYFDAIYFDPFSITKNPEMWSVDVFTRLKDMLTDSGYLVTYACGKKARENMLLAGLQIEAVDTARGAFHPGTRCYKV